MPIFPYKFPDGTVVERICRFDDRTDTWENPETGLLGSRVPHLPARMSVSWQTFPFGVSGRFEPCLNRHVQDYKHRAQVADSLNLVEDDRSVREIEDSLDRKKSKFMDQKRADEKFNRDVQDLGGDYVQAMDNKIKSEGMS